MGLFKNTATFKDEEALAAKNGLPVLPENSLGYHFTEDDYVEAFWQGGAVVNRIRYTIGQIEMVFLTRNTIKGPKYVFTINDNRWGLSNGPINSVDELSPLVLNEVQHLLAAKEEQQKLSMDQIHASADVRWRSIESPEAARSKNEGKINALEVGKEEITMHVFKSGCYEKIVATGEKLSSEEVDILTAHLQQHPIGATAWTTIGEEKWDPAGANGKTPNATYNFERMIKISDNCSLIWKGKHTNPSKPGEAYRVNDTLEIVRS